MILQGNIVDVIHQTIHAGSLEIAEGRIVRITHHGNGVNTGLPYILPGFIDAHVHIESSMLVPSEFARLAVTHGTVATISDPHEIANVCGMAGVDFMINNGRTVNFKFYFGAPSCVPATPFETAGSTLGPAEIDRLLSRPEIKYLSEMMNFPGVIAGDDIVREKIAAAHAVNKPVDGHAPGLRGAALRRYCAAGITTDHECLTAEEALEKLQLGMKILIREGSAAKNFEALADLLHEHSDNMMFCSDDKHPDSLLAGHINDLCRRAVAKNIDVFKVLKAACVNPVIHYALDNGLLREGDFADCMVVRDLFHFEVMQTYISGVQVAENGKTKIASQSVLPINQFHCKPIMIGDLHCLAQDCLRNGKLPVIGAREGQLITDCLLLDPKMEKGAVVSDPENDVLKIVVVNRYASAPAARSFIKNFGLKQGAIASSVAHDSHNIIAVGVHDEDICNAVNAIIENQGGISCASGDALTMLPLPIAGLMSSDDAYKVANAYTTIDAHAKMLGSPLAAPFMTLSFMALLVIPSLKLSDKGLFNGDHFCFV